MVTLIAAGLRLDVSRILCHAFCRLITTWAMPGSAFHSVSLSVLSLSICLWCGWVSCFFYGWLLFPSLPNLLPLVYSFSSRNCRAGIIRFRHSLLLNPRQLSYEPFCALQLGLVFCVPILQHIQSLQHHRRFTQCVSRPAPSSPSSWP